MEWPDRSVFENIDLPFNRESSDIGFRNSQTHQINDEIYDNMAGIDAQYNALKAQFLKKYDNTSERKKADKTLKKENTLMSQFIVKTINDLKSSRSKNQTENLKSLRDPEDLNETLLPNRN